MFTKNKILLGLALALFTFAAPNRAQAADPFFFRENYSFNNNWYFSRYFGYTYMATGVFPPWIYKNGFGWLSYLGNDQGDGSFFWDYLTGDTFYTNARAYDLSFNPQRTFFYSYALGTWLYYFEDADNNNRRTFQNLTTGEYIYYP